MKSIETTQINILIDSIKKSITNNDFFNWEIFFRNWFRENGTPLFFLFKKNLSVTNTQFVELFSLITNYCKRSDKSIKFNKCLFYSTEHIKNTFSELITTLLEDYDPNDDSKLFHFAEKYLDIFISSIAVDMFFGSCAIFLPNGLEVDIEKVVYDSGYIHSGGHSIYIRNIKKSRKNIFLNSIKKYIGSQLTKDEKIPLIVYSHEDFSGFDKDSSDLIERGIEQCKIFVEKMNMGSYRLSSIINELKTTSPFKNRLIIPDAGNYLKKHDFTANKTLWLISDKSVSGGQMKNPGQNRYYICYEQIYKNDSPFFLFDENKPAWKSHTTLPHSLTSALLNISRQFLNNGVICDPFGGTGTTWFEAKRLNIDNLVHCSDLSPAASLLVSDNLKFFTMSVEDLEQLIKELDYCYPKEGFKDQLNLNLENYSQELIAPYSQAKSILDKLKHDQPFEDQEFVLKDDLVKEIRSISFTTRIVFYIALRAELRFQSGFKRNAINFEEAFKRSLEKLKEETEMLLTLKKNVYNDKNQIGNDTYIISNDTYSKRLTPVLIFKSLDDYTKNIESEVFSSFDARNLSKASNDLVICDPPYGFNTTEDLKSLVELYSQFIDKAIDSLKPHGQLIMCLPAESYTGRDLPYCTRSDLISRQILIYAQKKNRLVYIPAKSVPSLSLTPPYYWESERALRRIILHFHFI